jgi:hypothetical protein
VTNAHNLAMVALTSRMQHERNYMMKNAAPFADEPSEHRHYQCPHALGSWIFAANPAQYHYRMGGASDRVYDGFTR